MRLPTAADRRLRTFLWLQGVAKVAFCFAREGWVSAPFVFLDPVGHIRSRTKGWGSGKQGISPTSVARTEGQLVDRCNILFACAVRTAYIHTGYFIWMRLSFFCFSAFQFSMARSTCGTEEKPRLFVNLTYSLFYLFRYPLRDCRCPRLQIQYMCSFRAGRAVGILVVPPRDAWLYCRGGCTGWAVHLRSVHFVPI